mmetsp:Transcript_41924/g.97639  ORF Transcript_41924/g.97639 Transcript_41924/m.97639 type:complete len:257 (-) Transcript_41924:2503-3273(-)
MILVLRVHAVLHPCHQIIEVAPKLWAALFNLLVDELLLQLQEILLMQQDQAQQGTADRPHRAELACHHQLEHEVQDLLETMRGLLKITPHTVLLWAAPPCQLRVEIGNHVVHHSTALHLHPRLKGEKAFFHTLHEGCQHSWLQFHNLRHVTPCSKLHEVIIWLQGFQVGIQLLQWYRQAEAQRQRHGVRERVVTVQLKDSEIGVVPVKSMGEHVETHANSLVFLNIYIAELRPLQYPCPIGHQNCRCFSEQENAIW